MIPGSFSYHRPASVADAIKLLASLGEDARPLAGGHSLVPMMKLRLATPAHLVDLHGIAGLKGIIRSGDERVRPFCVDYFMGTKHTGAKHHKQSNQQNQWRRSSCWGFPVTASGGPLWAGAR